MDPRLKHPFTCLLAGPSGSGKTTFIHKLITHLAYMIDPLPGNILYHYNQWQPVYDQLKTNQNITFVEGVPENDTLLNNSLVIIDDLMNEADDRITKLFTRESHHRRVSVIHIVQNLFSKNKEQRTINLNTHYIVLFKNPRDRSQITHLASQMYPGKTKYMNEAYRLATIEPYSYLLIDLKQETHDNFRLRTHIFPGEQQIVFVPTVKI